MIKINIQKELKGASGKMILDVNFQLKKNECIAIYGKSGVGKTTLLRILAGLMKPEEGRIEVEGEEWLNMSKGIFLRPQQRKLGFLFQDYGLFPNMTVLRNLTFALQKNQSPQIIQELIEIMELGDLKNQMPQNLSGGQQQRVALARALVQQPKLLLLDEPLSALDIEMREKLQGYLLEVRQTYEVTTILVSHDRNEILKLADRIIHLDNGEIIQDVSANDFFNKNNIIQLNAVIQEIFEKEGQKIARIKVNNQVLEVEIKKNNLKKWQKGKEVQISFDV